MLWAVCCVCYVLGSVPELSFNQSLLANLRVHLAGVGALLGGALLFMRAPLRGVSFIALGALGGIVPVYTLKTAPIIPQAETKLLDVISFNVLHYNKNGADILNYLLNSEADVLVLAESEPLRPYQAQLKRLYPYSVGCSQNVCELAIFSKYPFSNASRLPFPLGGNRLSRVTINLDGQDVRIIATHLTKSFFSDLRIREIYHIIRAIKENDTPYILAGDFNAVPWSPEIKRLLTYTDTYLIQRIVGTWPVALNRFGLPIDHIMLSSGLTPVSYDALPSAFGSNHRGVRAQIAIK